jgi:hypothetical protein
VFTNKNVSQSKNIGPTDMEVRAVINLLDFNAGVVRVKENT